MQSVKAKSLQILTKGQKAAMKSDAQKAEISAQKLHKDSVMKAALAFINGEVAENLLRDKVEDFKQKGFQTYNYYVDTDEFEDELPGGVIPLPDDLEPPTQWDAETKTQVPIQFTLNGSLRSKSLRMYVQEILDQEFPGFTIRIFAEDFQNDEGNPAKFTIKLSNPGGKSKKGKGKGKGGKGKGKQSSFGKGITAGRTLDEFEAEQARKQEALNK